jgi:hypothetical protein
MTSNVETSIHATSPLFGTGGAAHNSLFTPNNSTKKINALIIFSLF